MVLLAEILLGCFDTDGFLFGLGLVNPSRDLTKQQLVSHTGRLSSFWLGRKPAVTRSTLPLLLVISLYYTSLEILHKHTPTYTCSQSNKLTKAVAEVLTHSCRFAFGSTGKHHCCVFMFILWLTALDLQFFPFISCN